VELREIQRLFWRAITWPTGVDDFLAHTDPETRRAFHEVFRATPELSAAARVGVYAESYYWRIEDVLRDQFRVTAWACGDVDFHDLCTDYVLERPSTSGDVRRVGQAFPAYVRAHPIAARVPGIDDVAAIEWSAVVAIDAPDVPKMRAEDLAQVAACDWPAMRLCAVAGVAVHESRLPYAAMWHARERGGPRELPAPCSPPQHVLVWRCGLEVFHRTTSTAEAGALAALVRGASFQDVCAAAVAGGHTQTDAGPMVDWLRRWLADGLVAAP
jgi:hypothetical protein